MAIDEAKLNDFIGAFAQDLGAVLHAATVLIGDRLGLYQTLAREGPERVRRGHRGELPHAVEHDVLHSRPAVLVRVHRLEEPSHVWNQLGRSRTRACGRVVARGGTPGRLPAGMSARCRS